MTTLVLLRHGESEWNKANRFTGWTDVPLSEKGIEEAEAAGRLLLEGARTRMLTPTRGADGRTLPYGLGWFTQIHAGTRLVWHYGWNPPTASALYLKLPDEDLTFIALANTDALSRPFELGRSDSLVLDSLLALTFYEAFVLEPRRNEEVDLHMLTEMRHESANVVAGGRGSADRRRAQGDLHDEERLRR